MLVSDQIGGLALAALPGVFVALLSSFLAWWGGARQARRANANARAVLGFEMESNRQALEAFWREITALDDGSENANRTGTTARLAAMVKNGLFGHTLPAWSVSRWQRFPAQAFGSLNAAEVKRVDAAYRDLQRIGDLYARLTTLSPQETALYSGSGSSARFWHLLFADDHARYLDQMQAAVERVVATRPITR